VNVSEYDRNYNSLYLIECAALVLVLGIAARGAPAGWKVLYLNLMAASALYALDSGAVNLSVTNGGYYTGSLYDVPLIGAVSWMAATALTAREWHPEADGAAAGVAGDSFLAGTGTVGLPMGQLAGSGAEVSSLYRIGGDAGAGRFRVCAPVSAGPGVDPSARGFAA
jgi:hypothetical protein